jgi:aspartate/methionine/tyrosine aminotransferase
MFSRRTSWQLAPNRFSLALEKHRAAGREVLDLTASNPTEIGLRYEQQVILNALGNPEALHYRPEPQGLKSAREAVAAYYGERGEQVDPGRIVLTTSTSEAYAFVFRLLCDAEDEVLVPAPSYPLFEFLADLQDVRLRPYPLLYDHGWQVDLHALRAALTPRTRALMAVHPNNPTGSYLKPSEAKQLSAVCADRGLALVVDEVFLDFAHDGVARPSLAAGRTVYAPALTFSLSGLSKIAGLPQMKFAWIAVSGPEELVAGALARLEVISDTYLSVNAPVQLAAPVFFEQRREFQRQLMVRIHNNLAELDRQVALRPSCTRLEVEGGWYAVLRVPATRPDEELAVELLEQTGVLVHPGHFYAFPADGYIVLSLITPEGEFREGLSRVVRQFQNLKF